MSSAFFTSRGTGPDSMLACPKETYRTVFKSPHETKYAGCSVQTLCTEARNLGSPDGVVKCASDVTTQVCHRMHLIYAAKLCHSSCAIRSNCRTATSVSRFPPGSMPASSTSFWRRQVSAKLSSRARSCSFISWSPTSHMYTSMVLLCRRTICSNSQSLVIPCVLHAILLSSAGKIQLEAMLIQQESMLLESQSSWW